LTGVPGDVAPGGRPGVPLPAPLALAAPAAAEGPVLPGLCPLAAPLAGFVEAASVLAGGGGALATGARLPAGGNCPPPESASCDLLATALRAGLLSASLRAPAKSWLLAGAACEPVEADALVDGASLLRCA